MAEERFVYEPTWDLTQVLNAQDQMVKSARTAGAKAGKAYSDAFKANVSIETKPDKKAAQEEKNREAALKRLLIAELKAAAGADKLTKEFIDLTAAGSKNASALLASVETTDRLSASQIRWASRMAVTKSRIIELSRSLTKEETDVKAVQQEISQLIGRLNTLDDAQEAAASSTQKGTDALLRDLRAKKQVKEATDDVAKSHKRFGAAGAAAMGILAGATAALTRELIQLGKKAVTVFANILKSSLQVATEFDLLQASFLNIFEGAAELSDTAFDAVLVKGRQVGVDLTQVARRFLPLAESMEQVLKLGELTASLALLQPEQGVQGALLAIQDLVVGEFTSFRKRFELPVSGIQDLQDELGMLEGAIEGLDQLLLSRGVGFEQLQNQAKVSFNRMGQEAQQFQAILGEPIKIAAADAVNNLLEFIEENRDELNEFAKAWGEVAGAVISLLSEKGEEFLSGLDIEQITKDINALAIDMERIGLTVEQLSDLAQREEKGGFLEGLLPTQREFFQGREIATMSLDIKDQLLRDVGTALQDVLFEEFTDIEELDARINQHIQDIADNSLGIVRESAERVQEYDAIQERLADTLDESTDASDENTEATEEQTAAKIAAVDAALALARATDAEIAAQSALAKATEEAQEKILEQNKESREAAMQAELEHGRDLLDIAEDFSNQRIDLEQKYIEDINKRRRKFDDKGAAAALAFDRKNEDIDRKHLDRVEDEEIKSAEKRLDIEDDFQKRLAAIRRKFDFDAEEAIRANDAVALRRIRRRMEFELNEARIGRDDQVLEEQEALDQRKEMLDRDRERERRDAEIANQRKIEDIAKALEIERRERYEARRIEARNLEIDEARKREAANKNFERRIADIAAQNRRMLLEIGATLDDELAALREAEAAKLALMVQSTAALVAAKIQQIKALTSLSTFGGLVGGIAGFGTSSTPGGGGTALPPTGTPGSPYQRGGFVRSGQPALVGEPLPGGRPNPELFVPGSSGFLFPMRNFMFSPQSLQGTGSSSIDNSRHLSAQIGIPDPNGLSPVQRAETLSLVNDMLLRVTQP
jgi:hypothetical protein